MRFIPFIVAAVFFVPPVLFAISVYVIWRKEGSLRANARTIITKGLIYLAPMLVGVIILLTMLGRTVPTESIPLILAAGFFVPPVLFAVSVYAIWRREGSLRTRARAIITEGLANLAPLLVGVIILLTMRGRTVPTALNLFIGLLVTATIVIKVSDAIRSARSGSGTGGPHLKHK